MNRFNKETFSHFLKWIQETNKEKICNDFLNEEDTMDNILFVFNINGVQENEYYNITFNDFNKVKENILNALQNNLNLIDDDLNVLLKEEDYPNDSLYFIDIYIENRETNLKILYGTYYPEGFEEKYEVINESY